MLILLPRQKNGLPGLLNKLLDPASLEAFKKLFNKATYTTNRFIFHLPKFTLGGESVDLKDKLVDLGLREVFTPKANFSGLSGEGNLFINKVMHQAVIEVSCVRPLKHSASSSDFCSYSALPTHVLCKPTHFFFHSFIATMSYSLQTSFNSVVKDWADKYHVCGTPKRSPSRSISR